MSTCWPLAGGVALAQRGEHADHGVERRSRCRPARRPARPAGGCVALALELVDARHRLDDRGERRPRVVRRRCRASVVPEPGHREVDDAPGAPRRCRRSRGRGGPWRRPCEFSATTSNRGARRSTRSRPGGGLQVDADAALVEVVAQERGADRAALGVGHRRAASRGRGRRPSGARPSRPRRRGGPAAAWRRGGPASARGRGCGRRRAACPAPDAPGLAMSPRRTAATVVVQRNVTTRQIPP